MQSQELEEFIQRLKTTSLQVRTGLVLAPLDHLPRVRQAIERHAVDVVDYLRWKLDQISPQQRFANLAADTLLHELTAFSSGNHSTGCVLVLNVDIALARLTEDERERVLSFLLSSLKRRPCALILLLPEGIRHIVPARVLEAWRPHGRLLELS